MKRSMVHRNSLVAFLLTLCLLLPYPMSAFAESPPDASSADAVSSANLALHRPVEASTDLARTDWGWSKDFLVDGSQVGTGTISGWTSVPVNHPDQTEWVSVDLGAPQNIREVVLWPRNDAGANVGLGFPEDFTVEVSLDKSSWTTISTQTGYAMPSDGAAQHFGFDPVQARYVKVTATKLHADPFGQYVFQLAEMEVFSALSDLTDEEAVAKAKENLEIGNGEPLTQSSPLPLLLFPHVFMLTMSTTVQPL